jgi:hypothetical protein
MNPLRSLARHRDKAKEPVKTALFSLIVLVYHCYINKLSEGIGRQNPSNPGTH